MREGQPDESGDRARWKGVRLCERIVFFVKRKKPFPGGSRLEVGDEEMSKESWDAEYGNFTARSLKSEHSEGVCKR